MTLQVPASHPKANLVAAHREAIRRAVYPSCLNCEHWGEFTVPSLDNTPPKVYKGCSLYKGVPPPDVIVFSCVSWVDEIPF